MLTLFYVSLNKDKPIFLSIFTSKTQNNGAWFQCFNNNYLLKKHQILLYLIWNCALLRVNRVWLI